MSGCPNDFPLLDQDVDFELLGSDVPQFTGEQSIHDEESIKYYKEELKAEKWVLDTLTEYHHIPFSSLPPEYYEINNKSAEEEKQVLWDTILLWEKNKHVTRVSERPLCTSPMSVITQPQFKTGKIKKRPCLDLSYDVFPTSSQERKNRKHDRLCYKCLFQK